MEVKAQVPLKVRSVIDEYHRFSVVPHFGGRKHIPLKTLAFLSYDAYGRTDAQMIELGGLGGVIARQIAQAVAAGKLGMRHGDKLRPTATSLHGDDGERLKFMSRNQYNQLREDSIIVRQGLISFLFFNDFWRLHCIKSGWFSGIVL